MSSARVFVQNILKLARPPNSVRQGMERAKQAGNSAALA